MLKSALAVALTIALGGSAEAVKIVIPGISTSATDSPLRTVDTIGVSPDGSTLAFVANLTGTTTDRLYTIPITGGTPSQAVTSSEVDDIPFYTPDGQTLVYVDSDGGADKVHRVSTAGGPGAVINSVPVSFGYRLSPDGQTVVVATKDGSDDVLRAFPTFGAGPVVNLSSSAVEGDVDTETFNFSNDGTEVYFATDSRFRGANESTLYRVPVTGGPAVEIPIAGPVLTTFDIDHVFFVNDLVYFKGDYAVNGENRINTLPITGGVPQVLEIEGFPTGSDVDNFAISPDGKTIAFSADLDSIGIFELFVVPIEGGAAVKVSDPFSAESIDLDITGDGVPDISDGNIDSDVLREPLGLGIVWTADSRRIVYLADGEVDGVFEPYVVENPLFEAVPGDYNSDGLVNAADYTVWRDTSGSTSDLRADGDASGQVGPEDYAIWAGGYGGPGPADAGVVPEPCAVGLWLTGAFALAVRRRRCGRPAAVALRSHTSDSVHG